MIYILSGNDNKKKNYYLKKLYKNNLPIFIPKEELKKETIFDYAGSVSLFGESPIVIFDNLIKEGEINFEGDELETLQNSKTVFVFKEDKLLVADAKKYKKYGTFEEFVLPDTKQAPKTNIFGIADAFARKDKINAWILYRNAIENGLSPEEVSGIIFWKIKTMLLSGAKTFSQDDLKKISSDLVTLYHKSHRGESDFTIGLEQFILSSLSK